MTDTYLGQILQDGEWNDYARGQRDETADWARRDPDERRIVHWIYKERVLWENGDWLPVHGTFTLNVRFGNAAMQTADDLARALRTVADTVAVDDITEMRRERTILDTNGQTVGYFSFTPED